MTKQIYARHILIDEPSSKDLFQGKGHEKTAYALASAIEEFQDEDRAIGLDGPWGSGKSSIVEMAGLRLNSASQSKATSFHFFTFDIWKSQGSGFRRTFLEHLIGWCKQEFPQKTKPLTEIEKRVKGKIRTVDTKNHTILDYYGIAVLLALPFLPIYYFWAKWVFDKSAEGEFLTSSPMLTLYGFLALTLGRSVWRFCSNEEKTLQGFLDAMSKTLLISAKQYEDQKVTQHIREVDPNDFEFQETLRQILSVVQSDAAKVVVILDNIDRLPSDEISDYWALVRSIFSRTSNKSMNSKRSVITAVVPYDRQHITQDNKSANIESTGIKTLRKSNFSNRELFSKTFDEILTVAPPVMSNSKEFFESKIQEALPNFDERDELFRVYLIFNSVLRQSDENSTPRQIIAFINELTSLFSIHQGGVPLTTVAAYIAHRDEIESNPLVITTDEFLSDRIKTLCLDNELEKNLAAIAYNVDPELSFQILLDSRIKLAASDANIADLTALSKSPGFDLRVDEVVRINTQEWISADEYSKVIRNFSVLFEAYDGEAKPHISASLLNGFSELPFIALGNEKIDEYFDLLDMASNANAQNLANQIVRKGLDYIVGIKTIAESHGEEWAEFLRAFKNKLIAIDQEGVFLPALASVSMPSTPEFVLAVCYQSHDLGIPTDKYESFRIKLPAEETPIEDLLEADATVARSAIAELRNVDGVPQSKWTDITSKSIEMLMSDDPSIGIDIPATLGVLSDIYTFSAVKTRSNIGLENLLTDDQFYKNLAAQFDDAEEENGIKETIYLAKQAYLSNEISVPRSVSPNGTVAPDGSDEFKDFKKLFDGEIPLSEQQIAFLSSQIKEARCVTTWLGAAAVQDKANKVLDDTLRHAFTEYELPSVSLLTVLQHFNYLRSNIGDKFADNTLLRFSDRISDKSLEEVTIDNCPPEILELTEQLDTDGWNKFRQRVKHLLNAVPPQDWTQHLEKASKEANLLLATIKTNGIVLEASQYREGVQAMMLAIFEQEQASPYRYGDFDQFINGIDQSFHSDIFRSARENTHSVTASSLSNAALQMPMLVEKTITAFERLTAPEKDSLIRNFLCPALEDVNRIVLGHFETFGYSKLSKIVKDVESSTQDKLAGSLKVFKDNEEDRAYTRTVLELIEGKRKAKSIWEMWFPVLAPDRDSGDDENEVDDQ